MQREDSHLIINSEYLKILRIELLKRFPSKTQVEIAKTLGLGINTYHNLIKNKKGSIKTLDTIADYCNIIRYKNYKNKLQIVNSIKDRLIGKWVSYRFDSNRRLYESYWTFKYSDDDKSIKLIGVTKETLDRHFTGIVSLNPDLTLRMSIKSSENHKLNYNTVFFENLDDLEFYKTFKYLIFEVLFLNIKQAYTSLELFIKIPPSNTSTPKLIKNTYIPIDSNTHKIPTNNAYLAYNYLTRFGGKTRRNLNNLTLNQKLENGSTLRYKHDIFISCPIAFIKNEKQFIILKKHIDHIKEVLIDMHGFSPDNIYCELGNYDRFDKIPNDSRHLYFRVRDLIGATHFIALIPNELGNDNSGIYMEIYFRILKKLPGIIFLENRSNLPSLLQGLTESSNKPVNISFRDIEISKVANYIKDSKDYLFQFVI